MTNTWAPRDIATILPEVESWLQSFCDAKHRPESGVCDDGYSIIYMPVTHREQLFIWRDGEAMPVRPGEFVVRHADEFFVFGADRFLGMEERI